MDMKDSLVNGSVVIAHQIHEGKHEYEVENVVKYKEENGGKLYVRKGDKLLQINGVDLKDLTPEELANALAEGNPMLTVYKPAKEKGHTEQTPQSEDTLHPVSKESTVLNFSWELTSEDNEVEPQGEEKETGDLEGDVCEGKTEENEMLIIEMTKTSISLVRGRGCGETGCTLNDIIMVAESSTVTLVPRGGGTFRQEKLSNVLVEHVATHQYLRGVCSQRTVYASPNPEKITIYYYKSSGLRSALRRCSSGMPVVLNLTDSNCFLMCCKQADRVLLKVETCEKQKLKQISKNDESALSFVFYMKGDAARQRKFESALHRGWFIKVFNTDSVGMAALDGHTEAQSFLFIIQK